MTGPLAQQFAQVREESALLADWAEEPLGMGSVDADNVRGRLLAALSVIERHVQDMEKALRDHRCENHMKLRRPTGEVYCSHCAALSVREKGEE